MLFFLAKNVKNSLDCIPVKGYNGNTPRERETMKYENQIKEAANYYEIAEAANDYEIATAMDKIKFHNVNARKISENYTTLAIDKMNSIADEFGKTYEQVLADVRSFVK